MRRLLLLLALSSAMLGSLVAVAAAVPAPKEEPEEVASPIGFEVPGTNGFTIIGSAYPRAYFVPHGDLQLTVRRGKEMASYDVPAKVTAGSIHASLGRLGRVDLVLHRSGQVEDAHVKCVHRSEPYEAGTWEGVIAFRGEGDYTEAHATTAAGLPALLLADQETTCENRSSGESLGGLSGPGARLKGISYAGGRTLRFQLNKNRRNGRTIFTASLSERDHGLRIYRTVEGVAPAAAFRFDPHVRTATLAPPSPFSGTAHLRRSPTAVSPILSGNLALAFPGRTVPLAGPSVHVGLEHARQTTGDESGTVGVRF